MINFRAPGSWQSIHQRNFGCHQRDQQVVSRLLPVYRPPSFSFPPSLSIPLIDIKFRVAHELILVLDLSSDWLKGRLSCFAAPQRPFMNNEDDVDEPLLAKLSWMQMTRWISTLFLLLLLLLLLSDGWTPKFAAPSFQVTRRIKCKKKGQSGNAQLAQRAPRLNQIRINCAYNQFNKLLS